MSKLMASGAALALSVALVPGLAAAQPVLGADAQACRQGSSQPALIVNVRGLKTGTGTVRVALYGSDPAAFLKRGQYLRRIDVPVNGADSLLVCVAVPRPGDYAVAVRHDVDGNGRSGWNDGGGFSRNPRLRLPNPRPRHQQTVISVGPNVQTVDVVLNYRFGLSIRPVAD